MKLNPIDRERWHAVAKAEMLIGMTNGVSDETALCTLLVWAEENPDAPEAAWCKRHPSKRQREAFRRDWKALTGE